MYTLASRVRVAIGFVLITSPLVLAQVQTRERTLTLNGRTGTANVIQFRGRSYVDLESLARIANGSVGFRGNQISLTVPTTERPRTGLSREFSRAGIDLLGTVREWVTTLDFAVRNGYPVTGTWVDEYRNRTAERLRITAISASTPSDSQALQLLESEFNHLQAWSTTLVAARNAMNAQLTVNPSVVENDPDFQRLNSCAQFLSSMLVSGRFADSAICH